MYKVSDKAAPMLQKSRAVITQDGGQRRLQQELGRISQLIFVKRMACFQKLLIFAIQPPHQEDSNFFPPAPQVTFSLSASFTRGYWRGKKKSQEKKRAEGKRSREKEQHDFGLLPPKQQHPPPVQWPFWSSLQLTWVCSRLHRTGDNGGNGLCPPELSATSSSPAPHAHCYGCPDSLQLSPFLSFHYDAASSKTSGKNPVLPMKKPPWMLPSCSSQL